MAQGDVGVEKARGVRGSLIVMMINVTVCTSLLSYHDIVRISHLSIYRNYLLILVENPTNPK